ncbi:MAG: insulinase family protein, partial [Myxococcota bacterium]
GYEALLTEIERVRRHGFRPGELERAKARVLNAYDQMAAEAEKTDSVTHATEIVRVFLTHEPMPGIAYENELAHRYVPELTVDELNTWADDWMRDRSRVVTVIMPAREGLAVPTDTDLAEIEARVAAADIPAPPEEAETGDILAALPEPGPVQATDEQYVDGLQFTGWTLANGVHVWFRETDFKQDEVRMRAFAPGGLATASEEDYVSASLAPEVVHRSGFGELDADGLSRWLAGHTVSVSHGLNENVRVASASTAPADLERTLQLVHAGFTAPRLDERGLELTRKQHVEQLRNREQDPNTAFYDAYTALLWPDDPRRQPWTVDTLDALSLERATAAWDRWMTDATGWTFVFVGNLPDDFQPLVERYLGSLPTGGEGFAVADRGVRPKAGQLEQTVRKGLDPKARVRLEYHGDFADNTFQRRNWLQGMGDVLAVLLREDLREERGGVYGVSVQTNAWIEPWSNYQVSIQFMCDPARVDELVAATTDIVAAFRTEGPAPEHVARVREQNRRSHQEDVRSNDFWLSAFAWALQYGQDPKEILAWDQRNDGLTADSVRAMAKELLVDQNRVKVVLMPAEATAQGEGAEGAEEHPQAH